MARVGAATRRGVTLPGIAFPIAVFAAWRVAQLYLLGLAEGDPVDAAFQWDGNAYRRILVSGYHVSSGEVRPVTAFFPGIAWVAKVPDLVLGHTAAMVLTANVIALLAFIAVWAVATEWRDEQLGRASVILIALWPASLFYWSFFSEAMFVATTAGAVWADRRNHRWLAALLLGFAALTRSQGVLVTAVLVGLRVVRRRRIDGTALLYSVAAVIGIAAVMYAQREQAGDALAFLHHQDDWGRSITFPWTALREGIGALKGGQPRLAKWLDLLGITAMGLAVVWAVWPRSRSGRRRTPPLPPESWLLTVAIVIVPLCSGLLSSMNRYVASAWAGFVILAAWLQTANVRVRWAVYGALALASIYFSRYWAQGEFIG